MGTIAKVLGISTDDINTYMGVTGPTIFGHTWPSTEPEQVPSLYWPFDGDDWDEEYMTGSSAYTVNSLDKNTSGKFNDCAAGDGILWYEATATDIMDVVNVNWSTTDWTIQGWFCKPSDAMGDATLFRILGDRGTRVLVSFFYFNGQLYTQPNIIGTTAYNPGNTITTEDTEVFLHFYMMHRASDHSLTIGVNGKVIKASTLNATDLPDWSSTGATQVYFDVGKSAGGVDKLDDLAIYIGTLLYDPDAEEDDDYAVPTEAAYSG